MRIYETANEDLETGTDGDKRLGRSGDWTELHRAAALAAQNRRIGHYK